MNNSHGQKKEKSGPEEVLCANTSSGPECGKSAVLKPKSVIRPHTALSVLSTHSFSQSFFYWRCFPLFPDASRYAC